MSSNSQARLFLGYWWLRGQAVDGVHRLQMTDLGSNSGSAVHWLRDLTSLHGLSEPQFLHLESGNSHTDHKGSYKDLMQ